MNLLLKNPTVAVLISTLFWGTIWIPFRDIQANSEDNLWMISAGIFIPGLPFLYLAYREASFTKTLWTDKYFLLLIGSIGLTATFYFESFLSGHVARAIILFYLTPIWSNILGYLFLKEEITPLRYVSLLLGLLGLGVILYDGNLPMPETASDWMALSAGVLWGLAMVGSHKTPHISIHIKMGIGMPFIALCFAGFCLIGGYHNHNVPNADILSSSFVDVLVLGLIWIIPAFFLTLKAAESIPAGLIAILLLVEIVVGIASAMWLAGETLTLREAIGASLVIFAGVVEPLGKVIIKRS